MRSAEAGSSFLASRYAHRRENDGVIARHEKPFLVFLAARIPDCVPPDHLTRFGLAGAVVACLGMSLSHMGIAWLFLAIVGLLMNWAGDSLDGTLARYRGIERPRYGFFVDHMTDVVAQALIVLGLGFSPYLRFDLSCLILVVYLAATVLTLLRLHVDHILCLTYGGLGPTELRVLLIGGIVVAAILGVEVAVATPCGPVGLYNLLASLFVLAAAIAVLMQAREHIRRLGTEDRSPRQSFEWRAASRCPRSMVSRASGEPKHGMRASKIQRGVQLRFRADT